MVQKETENKCNTTTKTNQLETRGSRSKGISHPTTTTTNEKLFFARPPDLMDAYLESESPYEKLLCARPPDLMGAYLESEPPRYRLLSMRPPDQMDAYL